MITALPKVSLRPIVHALTGLMATLGGVFFVLAFLAAMLTGGVAHAEPSVAEPHADDFLNSGIDAAEDGGLGHAVLAFERAHLAAPLDREIQDARAAAQAEARRRRAEGHTSQSFVEGEPSEVTWWRFFSSFRTDTYAAVLLAATWLLFGLLLARRRTERTAVRDALVVGSLLAVIFVAGAAMMWVGAMATQELGVAVVVEDEVRFRDAPDELARLRSQPNLYEGAVVVILEQRSEFSRIRLVDGEDVWVRNGAAIYVE